MSNKKIDKTTLLSFFIGINFLISYYFIYFLGREYISLVNKSAIIIMSWIGILEYIFILWTHKAKTKKIITSYIIFITFLYVFNFGQCFLWAVGIFTDDSILNSTLYKFSNPSLENIFLTQVIILMCIIVFHCGFLILCNKKRKENNKRIDFTDLKSKKFFFYMSILVIPISFYKLFKDYTIASTYGYRALYYGEHTSNILTIVEIIYYWFFPCLVGLLLSNDGKKKKKVYLIFIVFIIFNLAMGDRGSWIYALFIILYTIKEKFPNSLKLNKVIFLSALGYIGLFLVSAIKKIRNIGISILSIITILDFKQSPIVEFITEMGSTMQTTLVLVEKGWNIYPYGNTLLFALMGMISSKIITFLGFEYVSVSSWFSQVFLNIEYGAGFSLITEVYMNFGPILLPIVMMLLGMAFALAFDTNTDQDSYKILKNAIVLNALIGIVRNSAYYIFKELFWGVFVFLTLYKIFYINSTKKQ